VLEYWKDEMKIGYFVGKFPHSSEDKFFYGGGITVPYELAVELAERGHDIYIFTISSGRKSFIERQKNIFINRYSLSFKILNRDISLTMLLESSRVKCDLDIIHTHVGHSPMDVLAPLSYLKKNKTPTVITSHADIGSYGGISHKIIYCFYYNILIDRLLSHADIITSPSRAYACESILKKYKEKVVVIPNGIDLNDFNLRCSKDECRKILNLHTNEKIVLFVGGLEPRKAPDILIKAMSKVVKSVPNSKLVIVGSGSMEKMLKNLVRSLGTSEHIRFAGFVKNDEKVLYYRSADVFALPSLYEIFGIVNLEAMACGVPIVASKVGGIPEIVKRGENGLLVPPRDVDALADAIIYLLENEDIRKRMGERAKVMVKAYSWEKIAEKYEEVYKGLVE
jgi:N-acetyl-alpha-D-glucosaminyl L-malate synthase BshA